MSNPNVAGVSRVDGVPHAAGTRDVKVERLEEGLTAFSDVDDNPSGATPTVNQFDAGLATGITRLRSTGNIRTSDTDSGIANESITSGQSSAW